MNKYLFVLIFVVNNYLSSQIKTDANIFGDVKSNGKHLPGVKVYLKDSGYGTFTDKTGHYSLVNLPEGVAVIVVRYLGYETVEQKVKIEKNKLLELNFDIKEMPVGLGEIVVTGTRTEKRNSTSPIIVNSIVSSEFESLHANTISEAICFQTGLRLETNCQTCNYTQLRMNGLGGAYSQILINGKSLFSPILGLYGLEQLPTNILDKIEVVRGGGSALYGPFAIGGIVNLITKFPDDNIYNFSFENSIINNNSNETNLNLGLSLITDSRKEGISIFATRKTRNAYDHNEDGYSELPKLENNSFGVNLYYRPDIRNSIEANVSSIYEYRRGGDKIDEPPHEAQQSEERNHSILFGSIDYNYYFDEFNSSIKVYFGYQNINRKHYTGIIPEITNKDSSKFFHHFIAPPYGITQNQMVQAGWQVNKKLNNFIGELTLTVGTDFLFDEIYDKIKSYEYKINQTSKDLGAFIQIDLNLFSDFTLLAGLRTDKHNFVNELVFNPRIALLYNLFENTQLRLTYTTGFRPPLAFDTDIHIAFAGGGIQRISLAEHLRKETSRSISGSVNFDFPFEHFIYGFTFEGFFTELSDVFIIEEISTDSNGYSILEKRNSNFAEVYGTTCEARLNYDGLIQFESGFTYQKSMYRKPVYWSNELTGEKDFLRSPESYGYLTLTYLADSSFSAAFTLTFTGEMKVPHYGIKNNFGNPVKDELHISESFFDVGSRISYTLPFDFSELKINIFLGIQNIFNAYQNDFDKGKFRDSNYIYGPSKPRTIYFGFKLE
ncbi:MAG: TonB-dependent receptor [Ignavibacteriae bacterium]|nr:TonB-dependent receptor [Ignavibacteriota bacterium]